MNTVNSVFPDSVRISGESTGQEIRQVIDNELPVDARSNLMRANIFDERNDIVRFYNNVEKVQEAHIRTTNYDDAIKGNFISSMSFFVIFVVGLLMGVYVLTEDTRGKVPDSRVAHIATSIVDNLAKTPIVQAESTTTP